MFVYPDSTQFATKTVTQPCNCEFCPGHEKQIFDEDAYWYLDYEGNPVAYSEAMSMYAKSAFHTVASAQYHYRLVQEHARSRHLPKAKR